MMRVVWTDSAIADLREIETYLTTYSEAQAAETIERILIAAEWLLDFRSAGSPFGYARWRTWRPRKTRYILIYEPIPDGIMVVRVRHAKQDWRAV